MTWTKAPLGDLLSYIGKGVAPKYTDDSSAADSVMVLGQKCVRNQSVVYAEARFHDEAAKSFKPEKVVCPGDILVNATGVGSAGRVAQIVDAPSRKCITDGHVITLRSSDRIDPVYLGYFVKSKQVLIEQMAEGSTGQTEMNRTRLQNEVLVTFPESNEDQKTIAEFGLAIDRKIATNAKLNGYLEELFDSCFKQSLDMADETWDTASLLDIADYKNGLAMQKFRPNIGDKGLPVLKIRELGQESCGKDAERCRSDIDESVTVHDGDLVFSWSGTLLLKFWAGGDAGLNQHLFKVTSGVYPSWFYYAWTKHHLARFTMLAKDRATTMGHIKRSALEESEVLLPPKEKLTMQTKCMQPIIDQVIANKIEIRKLAALRDALLPKLMSGEIDVSKIGLTQLNSHLS